NEQGGINGRKIRLISVDDGYMPPKTVEQVRRLVEQDNVAFLFNPLGTAPNLSVRKYLNDRKIPQLFVSSGSSKWGDPRNYPWTMGWQPHYRFEARVYASYILKHKPDAKIAILYQNDDFGKEYIAGLREGLGPERADKMIIEEAAYQIMDPTIDSQIIRIKASGADTLLVAATPKFAALSIRKVYELAWKPLFFMTNVSTSPGGVLIPVGPEKADGLISAGYLKSPVDPQWYEDPGMKDWRAFMTKYHPEGDLTDAGNVYAFNVSATLVQVLKQCGEDLSRENIMRQAANLRDYVPPALLPGIKINTSPAQYYPVRQLQLERWDGKTWIHIDKPVTDDVGAQVD
ncbi:MAG: branched-chain amino acid transport system substrate-binding protein, partial [Alphaproteobacteria bacterium]|nr:branched-chain amino acid transport system substrate-binding protein [Alphaproteobacteria bacterium]